MASNIIANHGWDLVAAITQKKLNSQLIKIPNVPVKKQMNIKFLGMDIPVQIDVSISAPQVSIRKGSGHLVNVRFGITGEVVLGSDQPPIKFPPSEYLTVTTDLAQIEAELQPHPDQAKTSYDLIINMENQDAVVNMTLDIDPAPLASLIQVFEQIVKKDIGNGKKYKVTSFDLSNADASKYKALIPHVADFSFVEDETDAERSNLLVLMNTVTPKKGELFFNAPILPPDQDFMILVSNHLFLSFFVMPALIDNLKKKASEPDRVAGWLRIEPVDGSNEFWIIKNNANIHLDEGHDPWIDEFNTYIDRGMQALQFYVEVKADVTFLNIRVDLWDQSWQQLYLDDSGSIKMKQIKEDSNKKQSMAGWEWALAVLTGFLPLIITAIIFAIVEKQTKGIGGTFADLGNGDMVKWPNQKQARIKQIGTPGHVTLSLDVEFD